MGWVDTGAERWRDPRGPTIRPPSRVRTRTLLVLVSAVVGFIIGVQARQSGAPGGRLAAESPEDLTRILGDLNAEADSLAQEISTLRVKLLRYRSSAERDELLLADARKTLADLQVLGGVVPATGPGVALMIDDPDGQVGWDGLQIGRAHV